MNIDIKTLCIGIGVGVLVTASYPVLGRNLSQLIVNLFQKMMKNQAPISHEALQKLTEHDLEKIHQSATVFRENELDELESVTDSEEGITDRSSPIGSSDDQIDSLRTEVEKEKKNLPLSSSDDLAYCEKIDSLIKKATQELEQEIKKLWKAH